MPQQRAASTVKAVIADDATPSRKRRRVEASPSETSAATAAADDDGACGATGASRTPRGWERHWFQGQAFDIPTRPDLNVGRGGGWEPRALVKRWKDSLWCAPWPGASGCGACRWDESSQLLLCGECGGRRSRQWVPPAQYLPAPTDMWRTVDPATGHNGCVLVVLANAHLGLSSPEFTASWTEMCKAPYPALRNGMLFRQVAKNRVTSTATSTPKTNDPCGDATNNNTTGPFLVAGEQQRLGQRLFFTECTPAQGKQPKEKFPTDWRKLARELFQGSASDIDQLAECASHDEPPATPPVAPRLRLRWQRVVFEGQQPVESAVRLGLFNANGPGREGLTELQYLCGKRQGGCYAVPNPVQTDKPKGQKLMFAAALDMPPPSDAAAAAGSEPPAWFMPRGDGVGCIGEIERWQYKKRCGRSRGEAPAAAAAR